MEIVTILWANIRHKKGSFVSIILLMTIISMAFISIFGGWENITGGIKDAQERAEIGDVVCMIDKNLLSSELVSEVENHSLVRKVKAVEAIDSELFYDTGNETYEYGNRVFMQKQREGYRLFNSKGTGFLDGAPQIKQGEVYISQGIQTKFSCEIGETLTVKVASGTFDFRLAGILEDPELGASTIGWKNIFISDKDFDKIYSQVEEVARPDEGLCSIVTQFSLYKNTDCGLSDAEFIRQVNLDTGISDMGFGKLTREQSFHYTSLFAKIICIILIVFVVLLLVAVMVIICHSVSTGIEMEYTSLGIMKAQGFGRGRLRMILASQYLIAQLAGAVIGTLLAIPLCGVIGEIFIPITAMLPRKAFPFGKSALILLIVFVVSALCIMAMTGKIDKISPVRAITGGKRAIYFDSRLTVAIHKKMLSGSLAFRQFTSRKRQYVGVIAIVAILVFFMAAMMILANAITTTSAWESMGIDYSDLDITIREPLADSKIREVEESIRKQSGFQVSYRTCDQGYMSINGEEIMVRIVDGPDYIRAVSKGRAPRYNNEIVLTEVAADSMGLKMGDKVVVAHRDKRAEYIICGLNQNTNDAGVNFVMTSSAAAALKDNNYVRYVGYVLEDATQGEAIAQQLNEKYGEYLEANFQETEMDASYSVAIRAMTLIVYLFSVMFVIVVVRMVCSKAFIRERRDIGIYKALGFTSTKVRLQFAVRFAIVSLIGSVIGSLFAVFYAGDMLSAVLRLAGISSFHVTFSVLTFALPVSVICVCFFLFAFAASRGVQRVEVRELVIE